MTSLAAGEELWIVSRDLIRYASAVEVVKDLGAIRFDDNGLAVARCSVAIHSCDRPVPRTLA
ncbi:hypothetical protein ACFWB0_09250 [Rhodococcus sp. NPDC060086]|uniref:hypothetical protein n=1 Tax=Rhodococcus sp. NPDC060086 TaxID=3347055 RepID=UPI003653AA21